MHRGGVLDSRTRGGGVRHGAVNEVKLMSGGDGIPARPLYRDPMTVTPRHLPILATNHMPELSGDVSSAMVERLLVVPFPVTFVDLLPGEAPSRFRRQKDSTLKLRLETNISGVLKWLVHGAVAWYAQPGLMKTVPRLVLEFGRQYFEEQDRLASFLRDACVLGGELKVPSLRLLDAHNSSVDKAAQLSDKSLAKAMAAKGFEKVKASFNGYQGMHYVSLAFTAEG